jgi:hypothetical protein
MSIMKMNSMLRQHKKKRRKLMRLNKPSPQNLLFRRCSQLRSLATMFKSRKLLLKKSKRHFPMLQAEKS